MDDHYIISFLDFFFNLILLFLFPFFFFLSKILLFLLLHNITFFFSHFQLLLNCFVKEIVIRKITIFFLFYAIWFEKSQFTLYFMGNSNYRKICVMIILNSLVRTRSQNSQMTIINYGTHYIHIKGSA